MVRGKNGNFLHKSYKLHTKWLKISYKIPKKNLLTYGKKYGILISRKEREIKSLPTPPRDQKTP